MAKKKQPNKRRSMKELTQFSVIEFCGEPCELDHGQICPDCLQWGQMLNRAVRGSAHFYKGK